MSINFELIRGRHQTVMNGDQPIFDSNGDLLVQDVQDNKMFALPLSQEVLAFFNLQFVEENQQMPLLANDEKINSREGEQGERVQQVSMTACWKDDGEVKCLIQLWHESEKKFKTMKSRDVWGLISEDLSKTRPKWSKKTAVQCENKWKDIKRKYTETKDHNNKSGNDPRTCKFYDELEEVLGEKPCVKPVALASSQKRKRTGLDCIGSDSEEADGASGSSASNREVPQQRRKMTRVQRELQDWSTALRADAKQREEAKERRHKEIIAESKVAVEAYKEIMSKLIDKL